MVNVSPILILHYSYSLLFIYMHSNSFYIFLIEIYLFPFIFYLFHRNFIFSNRKVKSIKTVKKFMQDIRSFRFATLHSILACDFLLNDNLINKSSGITFRPDSGRIPVRYRPDWPESDRNPDRNLFFS